ncbi:MAG: gliding motility-associated C-terminal domain-containing protein [Bacteroidetes bacterium]|nr:gliding motility-associated C-terminal domain-containing protein [Bacteroidota bacterium]
MNLENHTGIKSLLACVVLLIAQYCGYSQNEFVNNGSGITVQSGGLIFVQGELINADIGANIGLIKNSGTIALSGDWTNNSTSSALTPTSGLVELNGALQIIKGTQSTTFNNLSLLGTNIKRLNINTFVGGVNGLLNLTSRPLDLTSNTLIVTNPLPSAIIRTSGYIISETPAAPGYGIIQWNLANNTGNYIFPFGTATASYIPVFYTIGGAGTQSGVGSISASTYPTSVTPAVNNRPLPTGVNDLLNNCGTEHAKKMIDRFWVLNANNYTSKPTVIKKLTYVDDEWNTSAGSTNNITEPLLNTWHYNSSGWTRINSSNNTATNEQSLPSSSMDGIFTLGEYKQLKMTLLNTDSVKCFGQNNGVIQFSATTGYDFNTYSWNSVVSTDTIKTNLIAGTYTIIGTDALGCKDTLNNITIYQPSLLTQSLTANSRSICKNKSVELYSNFNGGIKPYSLTWSTGASASNVIFSPEIITVTPQASTQYISTLTDKNNCTTTNTIFINVNQLPAINFDADKKTGCQPLTVNFQNLSATTPSIAAYQWTFLQGSTTNVVAPNVVFSNQGSYNVSLMATSDSGCVNTITKNAFITVYEKPVADFIYFPIEEADLLNPKIDFQNTSIGNYVFSYWTFGDGASSSQTHPSHNFNTAEIFNVQLIVTTANSCSDTILQRIEVKDPPAVYIPNSFTPLNTDGLNDIFTIKGVNFYDFKMLIFDRWGEKIFESNDQLIGWNGKFKGKDCQVGVYIYQISFRNSYGLQKGTPYTYTGHVSLID